MTEKQTSEIFSRFKIFESSNLKHAGSTGVGLNLTKSLTELLGGEITIESTLGEYVEFNVSLPPMYVNSEKESQATEEETEVSEMLFIPKQKEITILIVEDENDLRNIVKKRLVKEHYSVDACGDGLEAMAYIDMTSYDGIILDIMLPGKDGYEILRELRQREDDTPVLLLTAKDSIEDRVKGLDLGADDYLIKPFAFEELLARIRVMMRRKPQFTSNQLKIADLILDRDTRKVTRAGNEIDLSAKEFMVLECLMRNKNIVMTRQQIEQNAWDFDFEGGSNVIDVYIRYLRKKIDAQYEQKLIHTVRGVGYVMRENE